MQEKRNRQFYPLRFKPIFKEKIWGGQKIRTLLGKNFGEVKNCGESWELSSVENNVSIISNGLFKGKSLDDLVQQYPEELLGKNTWFTKFPLLIKFLDANDDLSLQVHPDDALAKEKHDSQGKTEMWYIIDADPDSSMYVGFNRKISKDQFLEAAASSKIMESVNTESVSPEDAYFIPAGRIHSIGKGILLTEIQQTSDITYRIYDFNRKDNQGKPRELHLQDAADALNFADAGTNFKINYDKNSNYTQVVSCPYFVTYRIKGENLLHVNLRPDNSFRIYIVIQGEGKLSWFGNEMKLLKGNVILMPACISEYELNTDADFCGLEVFIT